MSTEHALHDFAVNICQPSLYPVVVIRQLLVIDAKEMQDGGVEVVPRDGVFDRLPAEIVRGTESGARLQSRAGEPAREAVLVVVAARADSARGRLRVRR